MVVEKLSVLQGLGKPERPEGQIPQEDNNILMFMKNTDDELYIVELPSGPLRIYISLLRYLIYTGSTSRRQKMPF